MPTTGTGYSAMSDQRRADLISGFDPTVVLEAASTVLADIERDDFEAVARRLKTSDRATVEAWRRKSLADGIHVAPTPVHPLAMLAATTLALGQSAAGDRTDSIRDDVARRLTAVALRFNDEVLEAGAGSDGDVLLAMTRSTLWRAIGQQEWVIWSGEIIESLPSIEVAAKHLEQFQRRTGISVAEWWYRGLGERATRAVHGARSWGPAAVDERVDRAWRAGSVATVDDAKSAARAALSKRRRSGPLVVTDPFDLGWLADRPVIEADGGRYFHLWVDAINRCLLPAGIAQVLVEIGGSPYKEAAAVIGRAAERILTDEIAGLPAHEGEVRVPEADMTVAPKQRRCDYVIEHGGVLLGMEFTINSPSHALSAGAPAAVATLVERFACKFKQVYATLERQDPGGTLRRLSLLVLVSPAVIEPVMNEAVHRRLVELGVVSGEEASELMTAAAPDFLDLLELSRTSERSLVELVVDWRDGPHRGTMLDWWLYEQGALRAATRRMFPGLSNRMSAALSIGQAETPIADEDVSAAP